MKAVVDPERIVLTGGLGSNTAVCDEIACWIERAGHDATALTVSRLGNRAGVLGAVQAALACNTPLGA